MHTCKICGTSVSFSILHSVCGICARQIRTALNRYEDYKAAGRYLDAGNDRGHDLKPLYLGLPSVTG